MAKQKSIFDAEGHRESDQEFHGRIQRQMDEDSWRGGDSVGASFPKRGIVHNHTSSEEQEPPHYHNWGEKKAGY
jgi:hypothetical protein